MLGYDFPVIRHIDDVLPAVSTSEHFLVNAKEGGYTVINYRALGNDVFPLILPGEMSPADIKNALLQRECRGIVFDTKTGVLLSRPFQKFFNLGERLDMQGTENLDLRSCEVMQKLDGSMVSPCWVPEAGGIRWMTKAGITTVSMQAETYTAEHSRYNTLAAEMINLGITPIFEWMSPDNRIVIDHQEPKLSLLALRENISGQYLSYRSARDLAFSYRIPVVDSAPGLTLTAAEMATDVRAWDDREGIVVRLPSGHLFKVKSEWYTNLHRLKDSTDREHVLVNVILDDSVDDILALVDDGAKEKLREYVSVFHARVSGLVENVVLNVINRYDNRSRKDFALQLQNYGPLQRSLAFRGYGLGDDDKKREAVRESLLKTIRKQSTNATSWKELRVQLLLPEYVRPF